MNEQLEKIKEDLDKIRKHPLVKFQISWNNGDKEVKKEYLESDKYCGGRILFTDNYVRITILDKDEFETIVDVLMKSYQFITQAEKLRSHRINSPSFNEALGYYISNG